MKIVYDSIVYSLQKAGGISLYWSQLEKYLEHDVIRMIYNKCEENIFFKKSLDKINNNNILYERYKNIKIPEKKPFVLHSSYYRYSKNINAVNILTVYDFMHEILINNIKSKLFSIQKKIAILNSSGIIFISKNTENDFNLLYPNYNGIKKVIYLGIESGYKHLNISKKNNVIFIGSREYYKNFKYAVCIIEKKPELKLQIVGGGKLEKKELSLLKNKIKNRYEYYPSLRIEELNVKYNEAKFLLYPSLYEGFGFPVVEAQAAGCPVVCCNVSSLPEVAGNAAVYISGKNIENDLIEISKLDNKIYYNDLLERGFKNSKRFSWKKCAKETLEFYQEVYRSILK